MARKNVRVVVPTNPDQMLELAGHIITKHTADGAASPLSGLDMAAFGTRVTDADTQNELAKQLRKDAELATESRDGLLGKRKDQNVNSEGTVLNIIARVRDILLGMYKGNEQQLGQWGFEVNQSSTGGNGSGHGGGPQPPGTGSITGTVADMATAFGISGAMVEVTALGVSATTDAMGKFTLPNIPYGTYTVKVSATGYLMQEVPVTVSSEMQATINVALAVTP